MPSETVSCDPEGIFNLCQPFAITGFFRGRRTRILKWLYFCFIFHFKIRWNPEICGFFWKYPDC